MPDPTADSEVDKEQSGGRLTRGLTPNVVRLGLVSLFADIASEMLYPLTPIFVTTVLGAPVAAVGLIEGAAEATASLLKVVSGRASDRTSRRVPWVFGGYLISALAKPMIALARSWPLVLVARVTDRVGKGIRTSPRDALLSASTAEADRGASFGWHRGMDTLGAVIGPLLGVALLSAFDNRLRLVIALTFIPGLISALLVLTVRDRPSTAEERRHAQARIGWRRLPVALRAYVLTWLPFVLANSSDVFLILRAKQLGASNAVTLMLYVVYNAVYAAASPAFGGLSDRVGRRRVLLAGLGVFALVYAGFALASTLTSLALLFAVYGVYTAATDGVGKAYAIDLAPRGLAGTAVGLLGTATGLAAIVASPVAGLLWERYGSAATFAYGAVGALVSATLLLTVPQLRRS